MTACLRPGHRHARLTALVPSTGSNPEDEYADDEYADYDEHVLFQRGEEQVTTGDVLRAVGQTRRTLTAELVVEFEQDIQDYARV